MKRPWLVSAACSALLGLSACGYPADERSVTIFAAASTEPPLMQVVAAFEEETGIAVRAHFAASSALARQVSLGARADIILLANTALMDRLESSHAITFKSRADLLSNSLVFVAPAARTREGTRLDQIGDGPFSMADPDHVPCGIYGRAALESMGLWDTLSERLVPAVNARASLAMVEVGQASLGLVYGSDAAASRRVRIVGEIPPRSQPSIRYPLALAEPAGEDAALLYERLLSASSREFFLRWGFTLPDETTEVGR